MIKTQQPLLSEGWEGLHVAKEKLVLVRGMPGYKEARKRTKSTYGAMIKRCYRPKCHGYKNYGGRGITVCDQWRHSYSQFQKDMGLRPDGMEIDRIDVNGHYEPSNCRWISRAMNARTRRSAAHPFIEGESAKDRKDRLWKIWFNENRARRLAYSREYEATRRIRNPSPRT